ncbi:HAD-IB family phosphatase [Oceanivirga salmonicida]|uniref:HAD-IB family phosphatase n=1 Tax=Oceanivirga salmonicida TaxID=1769291 RepID=UPI00083406B5|nr:HAD-IB family phosphatase [Oceanivirga salmonicida]
MKKAIIYDFDKTIYSKETSIYFMLFYIKKHPERILKVLKFLIKFIFSFKNSELKNIKNAFFEFIDKKNIDKLNDEIIEFWSSQEKNFFPYFKNEIIKNKKEADILILISASPDFLLEPIYTKLGFDILIATKFKNFKIVGNNCKGIEKLNRLNELGEFEVLSFYSDSMSDKPLFDIAKNKYSIDKKGNLHEGYPQKNGRVDKWK